MRYGFVIIFSFSFHSLFSQTDLRITKHSTVRDGLSNNTVYCVTQDSRDFLWLGTKEGLNRFDGFEFKKYFTEKNNSASLSNNSVFDLVEYAPGQLLIATGNGLSVLNTLTGKFENEKINFDPLKAGSGNIISSLFKDQKGNIWVNHGGELDVLDKDLKYLYRFTDLDWAKTLKGITIYFEEWCMDGQNRLWLPSDTSGLQLINFEQKKIFNRKNNPEDHPWLKHAFVRAFVMDETSHSLWIAPWGEGLIKYDLLTRQKQQQYFGLKKTGEERTINSIIKTNTGDIVCTIDGKCYQVDPGTLDCKSINIPTTLSGFEKKSVHSINSFKGNRSESWFGAYEGLFQLNEENFQKEILVNDSEKKSDCSDLMLSASGNIYAAFNDSKLIEAEPTRNGYKYYHLPGNTITELCEDHNNRIWTGTNHGIFLFDNIHRAFSRPAMLPDELKNILINTIFCDSQGDIWITTREPFFFYRFHSKDSKFEKLDNAVIRQLGNIAANGRISTLSEDKNRNLWMVSSLGGGIICYEKNNDKWKLYPLHDRHSRVLVKKGLNSLYADDKGYLWLSTYFGDGLLRYDPKNDSLIQFTRSDGLPGDYIQTITAGDNNNLWLTTEYGITEFDSRTLHSKSHLSGTYFSGANHQAVFDPVIKQLLLGLANRLVFVSSENKLFKHPIPSPVIAKITVNNHEQFIDPLKQTLKLNSGQKNISIDFTAVSYSGIDNLRFAYRLAGADNDWKYVDANRIANFTTLVPGSYTFHLKVGNENREWNPQIASFSFSIEPPWWQTWWFRVGAVVLVTAFVFWLFRRRIKSIRHESELKQKIAETEMMALRAQMNPHFIFNCINSIDAMIQSNDKYQATVYLNKFAKLIRNILDSSKQNLVPLSKDLETLQLYVDLELFRNENKFTAHIEADPALLQDDYQVPPLIVQPYVENAILHGLRYRNDNEGRLNVSIQRENATLKYEIIDNGVGRNGKVDQMQDPKKQKQAYGMQISNDRVRIFNNEEKASVQITDLENNGEQCGTKVTVQLKIQ